MAVTPSELLKSAKSIQSAASNEADYRSGISRYYYAGYHAAKDFHDQLPKPGASKANVGDHENLIHMLNNPAISNETPEFVLSKEISQYLKKALFNRRLADYQLNQAVSEKNISIVENEIFLIFDSI
jgi:uncharacterized protein (UPF0332 family)